MNSETRFILAVVLMLAVLVGGNLLFPPPPPELQEDGLPEAGEVAPAPTPAPPPGVAETAAPGGLPDVASEPPGEPTLPGSIDAPPPPGSGDPGEVVAGEPGADVPAAATTPEPRRLVVESPLYRFVLSNVGARLESAELLGFPSFTREGPVQLVEAGAPGLLGVRVVVEGDTIDLRSVPFRVSPDEGIRLDEGGGPQSLTFTYEHTSGAFGLDLVYTFDPASYLIGVQGSVRGVPRGLVLTDLGGGLAFNEVDEGAEARGMAYVVNHLQNGIRATELSRVSQGGLEDGPFLWTAMKSQYFVVGVLPSPGPGGSEYLGGVLVNPVPGEEARVDVAVSQSIGGGGAFRYDVYAGPQDYALLSSLGNDFQEVSPVGWRFLRPVLRPIVAVIMWVLVYLHETLAIGYGWVLILVGVLMRIVLFPLNHKAMRAQLRNMAVQPLLKEIQTKYKDQPEKMQKELMKLYKEHGFNPLAGCWPMLLPWPVLIALFFVFQNTIELRGVPFWWLPDLASKDPFYILPVLLGLSMFLLQWVSLRTMTEVNPQMKMMMWLLPIFMVVIFANLPSGLNLYYLTANIATLPQSWWIAQERQKVQAKGPPPAPVKV